MPDVSEMMLFLSFICVRIGSFAEQLSFVLPNVRNYALFTTAGICFVTHSS